MLVSWLAFWLDPADESGCRALTILFTVLALLALYSRASSQLVVGYTTYMDIFFGGCFGLLLINGLIFLMAMLAKRNSRNHDEAGARCRVNCLKRLALSLDIVARLTYVPVLIVFFFTFCYKTSPHNPETDDMIQL